VRKEYHDGLAKNYVAWTRGLVDKYGRESMKLATLNNLQRRPVFWTVGRKSDRDM